MQVRLLTSRAGYGWSQESGDVIDMPDDEARRLVKAGQAERMETRVVETAMVDHRSRENRKAR